jgi:hypothetical protein
MRFLLISLLVIGPLHGATLKTAAMPAFYFYERNVGQADADVRLIVRGGPVAHIGAGTLHLSSNQYAASAEVRFAAEAWPGVVNRFEGSTANWRRNIPAYRRVQLTGIYPGVDLILSESNRQPRFTYVVRPGADLSVVALHCLPERGRLTEEGDWVIELDFFSSRFKKPRAYQEAAGTTTSIDAFFTVSSPGQARLQAGAYDPSLALYLEVDFQTGLFPRLTPASPVFDASGNLYFTGAVNSDVTCSVNPGSSVNFCPDALVAGMDSQYRPLFFTVLAGTAEDSAWLLAIDREGKLVAGGNTASSDFPITAGAYQPVNAGPIGPRPRTLTANYGDLLIARLNPADGDLLYSTFYGGPKGDSPRKVVAGPQGDVFVLVFAEEGFPTTAGAWFRDTVSFCTNCAFQAVLRFDPQGSRPIFSTLVPGNFADLAVHTDGSAYVAGWTGTRHGRSRHFRGPSSGPEGKLRCLPGPARRRWLAAAFRHVLRKQRPRGDAGRNRVRQWRRLGLWTL